MPEGSNCETRPADLIDAAVMVAKIATGEIEVNPKSNRVKAGGGLVRPH